MMEVITLWSLLTILPTKEINDTTNITETIDLHNKVIVLVHQYKRKPKIKKEKVEE